MTNKKRILRGEVVSDASDKTIVVEVKTSKRHPLYSKRYTVSKKYHAHDENNEAQKGDVVEIVESPPISKKKRWQLNSVAEKKQGDQR